MTNATTLARFIIEEQRRAPGATGEFSALLQDLVTSLKGIALAVARGEAAPRGALEPDPTSGDAPAGHGAGEDAPAADAPGGRLAAVADDIVLRGCEWGGHLSAIASGVSGVHAVPERYPRGKYLLLLDPLDGARDLDLDIPAGTIFSVLRRAEGPGAASIADFLQPGARQVCAGYALYGPATLVVLTFGHGVHGFTLDRELGEFVLTHREMRVAESTRAFAIDASRERFWEPAVKRYVEECLAGRTGPREVDFETRWVASLVPDVHRILVRGGLFLSPGDGQEPGGAGRLSLLFAANPMAFLVEQAGGAASTGRGRLLDLQPAALDERVPVVLGSRAEVERIERYHDEHEKGLDRPYRSPLFGHRSLFIEL